MTTSNWSTGALALCFLIIGIFSLAVLSLEVHRKRISRPYGFKTQKPRENVAIEYALLNLLFQRRLTNHRGSNASIIAIHGLGAHGEYTWTVKHDRDTNESTEADKAPGSGLKPSRRINWLSDYLYADFP